MPDDLEQKVFEEMDRRHLLSDMDRKVAQESVKRGLLKPPANAPGKPAYAKTGEGKFVTPVSVDWGGEKKVSSTPPKPGMVWIDGKWQYRQAPSPQKKAAAKERLQATIKQRQIERTLERPIISYTTAAAGQPLALPPQKPTPLSGVLNRVADAAHLSSTDPLSPFHRPTEEELAQRGQPTTAFDRALRDPKKVGQIVSSIIPDPATAKDPKSKEYLSWLRGLLGGGTENIYSQITPENALMLATIGKLPLPAQKVAAGAFAGTVAPQAVRELQQGLQQNDPNAVGRASTSLLLSAVAARHATGSLPEFPTAPESPLAGRPKPPTPPFKQGLEPVLGKMPAPESPVKAPERPAQPSKGVETGKPSPPEKTSPEMARAEKTKSERLANGWTLVKQDGPRLLMRKGNVSDYIDTDGNTHVTSHAAASRMFNARKSLLTEGGGKSATQEVVQSEGGGGEHKGDEGGGTPTQAGVSSRVGDTAKGLQEQRGQEEVAAPPRAPAFALTPMETPPPAEKPFVYEPQKMGEAYHGSSRQITPRSQFESYQGKNLYGPGFYTTDSPDIAGTYTKKGGGKEPSVYKVEWTGDKPPNFLDLEKPLPPELRHIFQVDDPLNYYADVFAEIDFSKPAREVYEQVKDGMQFAGLTTNDADELLTDISRELQDSGYDGLSHVGGAKTGGKSHNVKIIFGDPVDGVPPIKLTRIEPPSEPPFRISEQPVEPGRVVNNPPGKPETTGIAQRVHEKRTPGAIQPGKGVTPEEAIEHGRRQLKQGANPEAIMQAAEKVGHVGYDDITVLRAQHEALGKVTNRANDAYRKNPTPENKQAYNAAMEAEIRWAERIKPLQTESSRVFTAQQGETDIDTGSFTGLDRAFRTQHDRPMTPAEEKTAQQYASTVEAQNTRIAELEKSLTQALEKSVKQRGGGRTSALPKDPKALREHFAKRIADKSLFKQPVAKAPAGTKPGAVNVGMEPRFTVDETLAIWRHLKETYVDRGVDAATAIANTANDLGLQPEWVEKALARDFQSRQVTNEMYRELADRRRAVNEAKEWVRTANDPKLLTMWRAVTNFPRGVKVFGHGAVGMFTHAGRNVFRPTSWPDYWRNVGRQYQYVFNKGIHERLMTLIENDPNYAMWRKANLKIDPNTATDDYAVYGEFIGDWGKAGNRGMDALKSFRLEYANRIWEGLPENLREEPGIADQIADWVNHVSGSASPIGGRVGEEVLFASRLESSRWAAILGDPIKTAKALINPRATPAEKWAAQWRMKRAIELAAVYGGVLAANNAFLSTTGSRQKVNFTDPSRSDFLRLKGWNKTFDPTGNVVGPARFVLDVFNELRSSKSDYQKQESVGKKAFSYARGKVAPQYGLGIDIAFGSNPIGRPLPWSSNAGDASRPRYTYPEYLEEQFSPIPVTDALTTFYDSLREQGVDDSTAMRIVKAVASGTASGAVGFTGIRMADEPKKFPKGGGMKGIPKLKIPSLLPKGFK